MANDESESVAEKIEAKKPPLYDILAEISKLHDGIFSREKIQEEDLSTESHISFELNPEGDAMSFHNLDCFAMNDGGFFVCFRSYGYMEPVVETFIYKDGVLSKTDLQKYMQPLTINDFYSNADKFPKPAYDCLTSIIESKLKYMVSDGKLNIGMEVWQVGENGYEIPAALSGFEEKDPNELTPEIQLIWNGEKFVRDPENKPVEEDLKYFESVNG